MPGSSRQYARNHWHSSRCTTATSSACSPSYAGGSPMTTHEEPRREQLERDLQRLAKPGETDDAFRLSLRAALIDRLQPPVEVPRWKRPVFRFALVGGAAAVVVASI